MNKLIPVFYLMLQLFISNTVRAYGCNIEKLPAGNWLGEIIREDGHKIPFLFKTEISANGILLYVINGTENLRVDHIKQSGDSVFIDMPFFDSHFALRLGDNNMLTGNYIKNYGDRKSVIPFRAIFNQVNRYTVTKAPAFNISGRWSVLFKSSQDSTEAVGEFKQTGSGVTGTFLTTTGDYRYLEGIVNGDTLKLSTFDGGHAYAFVSQIIGENKMVSGFYYAGANNTETWTAVKNEQAKLPDEYSFVKLNNSENRSLHFKFPDLNGKIISLQDPEYKNKVVIVQILGSWCPNCMDETRFLASWYLKNKSRGIEIVALAYERTTSFEDAKKLLEPFITRFHVTYPILATGVTVSDSLRTRKTLPELTDIVGFPTTIFIDKSGRVRKISTGFNGPGTGEHFEEFKNQFNELVTSLLTE